LQLLLPIVICCMHALVDLLVLDWPGVPSVMLGARDNNE
jgi:hypothetical protein